jgi:hypothetical protein
LHTFQITIAHAYSCSRLKTNWNSQSQSQSQSYITTNSQSSSPSCRQAPIWDPRPIFPILSCIYICLDSFGFADVGRPALSDEILGFQFLPGIAREAFLRSESHGTHEHILLSLFLDSPKSRL